MTTSELDVRHPRAALACITMLPRRLEVALGVEPTGWFRPLMWVNTFSHHERVALARMRGCVYFQHVP